jgi:LPS export ABC transporter permease LptF
LGWVVILRMGLSFWGLKATQKYTHPFFSDFLNWDEYMFPLRHLLKTLAPPYILTKYILKEITTFFLICLLTFVGILLTVRMLRLTGLVINKGVGVAQIANVFLAIIPTFLEIALPLSTLLGVMLAFARLSGDSEIVVLKASGIHFRSFTLPVIIIGLVVSLCGVVTSSYLKPWGFSSLAHTFFEIARTKTTAGISPGIFNELGVITLYSEGIEDQTGELKKVLLDDQRDKQSRKIVTAERGRILSDSTMEAIIFLLSKGEIHELINQKYIVTEFDSNRIILNPNQLNNVDDSQKGTAARELFPSELNKSIIEFKHIINLSEQGIDLHTLPTSDLFRRQMQNQDLNKKQLYKKLNRLYVEQAARWALPFASLVLGLVSLPLGIHPPRSQKTWGAGLSVVIGMFVFVAYYALLTLSLALAESQWVAPMMAVWLPNIITFIIGLYFIHKLTQEKWTSVASGIYDSLWTLKILKRFLR